MKKLYISADIEGVCGIVDWKETHIGEAQGAYFRNQMTREVNAACEAACNAGVADILVKDAHGSGRSIDPSALPQNVRILRAWTRDPYSMMGGIDSTYEGVCFIGYHSGAGTDGNPLAHTMNDNTQEIRINGSLASEFTLNAYTAAHLGIPVLLLTGDRALCETAGQLNPSIKSVAVSEGIGNASVSIHPELAVRRIREALASALEMDPKKLLIPLPEVFEIRIEFRQHHLAYRGSFYPGAKLAGPVTLAYSSKSWADVLGFLFFVL